MQADMAKADQTLTDFVDLGTSADRAGVVSAAVPVHRVRNLLIPFICAGVPAQNRESDQ
jgi:hypothetical protein